MFLVVFGGCYLFLKCLRVLVAFFCLEFSFFSNFFKVFAVTIYFLLLF